MLTCSIFCNVGAAPLLEEPNKRQNMNIPQLLCGDEKFQKVKIIL